MADQQGFDLFARRAPRVFSVSDLTRDLKAHIEGRYTAVAVEGELSNVKIHSSGHCYFVLKDARASISCAIFRTQLLRLRFEPRDGQQVLVRGRLSVYEERGVYQLLADTIEPKGAGALALRFEELKKRLAAEGLFDRGLKRPLPRIPRRIGVVTSPDGAAIADFLRVLHRRWPDMPVLVAPARVQGDGAAQEICRGIARLGRVTDVDVIVVTRGGGSLEDLWAFNEEPVARAIRRSPVPIVSAVGHETDTTISDFAADLRAATPSNAAELVVPEKTRLVAEVGELKGRLSRAMRRHLEQRHLRLEALEHRLPDHRSFVGERRMALDRLLVRAERVLRERLRGGRSGLVRARESLERAHPRSRLARQREELRALEDRLVKAMRATMREARTNQSLTGERLRKADPGRRIAAERALVGRLEERLARRMRLVAAQEKQRLGGLAARLDALSPLRVLARGYALAFDANDHVVQSARTLAAGDGIRVRFSDGSVHATVTAGEPQDERSDGLTPVTARE